MLQMERFIQAGTRKRPGRVLHFDLGDGVSVPFVGPETESLGLGQVTEPAVPRPGSAEFMAAPGPMQQVWSQVWMQYEAQKLAEEAARPTPAPTEELIAPPPAPGPAPPPTRVPPTGVAAGAAVGQVKEEGETIAWGRLGQAFIGAATQVGTAIYAAETARKRQREATKVEMAQLALQFQALRRPGAPPIYFPRPGIPTWVWIGLGAAALLVLTRRR